MAISNKPGTEFSVIHYEQNKKSCIYKYPFMVILIKINILIVRIRFRK